MKPSQVAKLAAQTPKWPELRVTLTDPAGITVSGLTTPLTTDDPPAEAVARAAAQARVNGRPIRVTVTTTTGEVNRIIVTTDGAVVPLDQPGGTARTPPSAGRARAARPPTGVLTRFPARLRPVIRWGGPAMAVLVTASLVVIVVHGKTPAAAATGPVAAPVPPAGQLYTELAPPGWSQHATWVLPLAADAPPPVTDPATGVTVAADDPDRGATGRPKR